MAFAGYSASQQRQQQHRGRGSRGKGSRRLILGCIPATLQNLALLVTVSGLLSVFFASRLISRAEQATQSSSQQQRHQPNGDGDGGAAAVGPSSAFCSRPNPLVCAHGAVGSADWDDAKRGGPRPLPNTVPALAAVVAAGHECVELDVSRTKDGHLVALHSRELRRLTDGRVSNPGDVTLAEVMALPVPGLGGGGHRVATFSEAMAAVAGRGLKQITVDFKDGPPHGWEGFAQAVLAEVGLADPTGAGCAECVYWGKEDRIMLDVVRELPEAKVGYTIANFSAALREAGVDKVAAGRGVVGSAYAAAVQSEMIDAALTGEVRGAGVERVYAWTVNDPARVRHVANQGVDGVVTDEPEVCARQLAAMRAACGGGSGARGGGWGWGRGGGTSRFPSLSLSGSGSGFAAKGNRKSLRE